MTDELIDQFHDIILMEGTRVSIGKLAEVHEDDFIADPLDLRKITIPTLIIHGEEDNNSGTFPVQSIRFFNAIKGHGGTSKLVMLPKESHGYRAKESILHMLYEMDSWLEKYVKNNNVKPDNVKLKIN